MIFRFFINLLIKLIGDEEKMMASILLAQRIILGKFKFEDVPNSLKEMVYEHLADSGLAYLAGDYKPPTPEPEAPAEN